MVLADKHGQVVVIDRHDKGEGDLDGDTEWAEDSVRPARSQNSLHHLSCLRVSFHYPGFSYGHFLTVFRP